MTVTDLLGEAKDFPRSFFSRNRLNKWFEIAKRILPGMPNRIPGACYSEFFKHRKPYNSKGEEVKL